MINRTSIWKPGIGKITKASKGIVPGHHKGALQRPIWTPSCKGQRADVRWVMAYEHKTQSFMENGGQQKCLDKALYTKCLDKALKPGFGLVLLLLKWN